MSIVCLCEIPSLAVLLLNFKTQVEWLYFDSDESPTLNKCTKIKWEYLPNVSAALWLSKTISHSVKFLVS